MTSSVTSKFSIIENDKFVARRLAEIILKVLKGYERVFLFPSSYICRVFFFPSSYIQDPWTLKLHKRFRFPQNILFKDNVELK